MSAVVLFALSLPGLVVLLVVLAAVEGFGRWARPRRDDQDAGSPPRFRVDEDGGTVTIIVPERGQDRKPDDGGRRAVPFSGE